MIKNIEAIIVMHWVAGTCTTRISFLAPGPGHQGQGPTWGPQIIPGEGFCTRSGVQDRFSGKYEKPWITDWDLKISFFCLFL